LAAMEGTTNLPPLNCGGDGRGDGKGDVSLAPGLGGGSLHHRDVRGDARGFRMMTAAACSSAGSWGEIPPGLRQASSSQPAQDSRTSSDDWESVSRGGRKWPAKAVEPRKSGFADVRRSNGQQDTFTRTTTPTMKSDFASNSQRGGRKGKGQANSRAKAVVEPHWHKSGVGASDGHRSDIMMGLPGQDNPLNPSNQTILATNQLEHPRMQLEQYVKPAPKIDVVGAHSESSSGALMVDESNDDDGF